VAYISGESIGTSVVVATPTGIYGDFFDASVRIDGRSIVAATAFHVTDGQFATSARPVGSSSAVATAELTEPPIPSGERFVGGAGIELWDKVAQQWVDISCQVTSAKGIWGTDRPAGILSVGRGGTLEIEVYDPERILDPSNLLSPVIELLRPANRFRLVYNSSNGETAPIREGRIDTITHTLTTAGGRIRGNDIVSHLLKQAYSVYYSPTGSPPSMPAATTLHALAQEVLAAGDPDDSFGVRVETAPVPRINCGYYANEWPNTIQTNIWQAICDAATDAFYFPWIDGQNVLHFRSHIVPPSTPMVMLEAEKGLWPLELALESSPDEIVNYVLALGIGVPSAPGLSPVWNDEGGIPGAGWWGINWSAPASSGGSPVLEYEFSISWFSYAAGWSEPYVIATWGPGGANPYHLSGYDPDESTQDGLRMYLRCRNSSGWGAVSTSQVDSPSTMAALQEAEAPTPYVISNDPASQAEFGTQTLDRQFRYLPSDAQQWANITLEDRKDPPVLYTPVRIWLKSEQELLQVLAIEGAQEVGYILDAVNPPVVMITRCVGANIQVDPDGWAVELLTYVRGDTYIKMVRDAKLAVFVSD
jgi:hypothetical protein